MTPILRNFRIPRDPILVVEDTEETQDLIYDICNFMGLKTMMAENGKAAMEILEKFSFSVYIVDLMMPVMDGPTFISLLKKKNPEAVIIVQTAISSAETIIDVMKLGIFDYVVKPIDLDQFQSSLGKAIEFKYLKDLESYQDRNAGKKLRSQLDWLQYKEKRRITEKDIIEIKSIYNLRTSFSQGAGAGSIITLLELLKNSLKEQGNSYIVDREILDLVFEGSKLFGNQIRGLNSILEILEEEFELSPIKTNEFLSEIPRIVSKVIPHLKKKKLKITFPDPVLEATIMINKNILFPAIEELIINACKYSQEEGEINIFSKCKDSYLWISVKNDVGEKEIIDVENEKLVVEPFYRIATPDESVAEIEKYSLGLGLTVVDNVARKHNGVFFIRSIKDHSRDEIQNCVLAEMLLPLIVDQN